MKQFKPIYCNFTAADGISIVGFNGWKNEYCEEWQGLHVSVTDTPDGLLYVVKLDREDDGDLDDCQTLGVYDESEIARAWAEIKSHIEKKESFSMPTYEQYKRQAVTVSRAYTLVTDCSNITGNAFIFCERTLEELQKYFATADGNPWLLRKLTDSLKKSEKNVEEFLHHTQELEADAKELVEAIGVTLKALEEETESPTSEKSDGKRAKTAQKGTESESKDGGFNEYLDLPY